MNSKRHLHRMCKLTWNPIHLNFTWYFSMNFMWNSLLLFVSHGNLHVSFKWKIKRAFMIKICAFFFLKPLFSKTFHIFISFRTTVLLLTKPMAKLTWVKRIQVVQTKGINFAFWSTTQALLFFTRKCFSGEQYWPMGLLFLLWSVCVRTTMYNIN